MLGLHFPPLIINLFSTFYGQTLFLGFYQAQFVSAYPTQSRANLLTQGRAEEMYNVYCKVSNKENGQLMLKRPKLPNGFQGKVFKSNMKGEGCGMPNQLMDIFLIGWW